MDGVLKNVSNMLAQADALGYKVETLAVPPEKLKAYWEHVQAMEKEHQDLKAARRNMKEGMSEEKLQKILSKGATVPLKKQINIIATNWSHKPRNALDGPIRHSWIWREKGLTWWYCKRHFRYVALWRWPRLSLSRWHWLELGKRSTQLMLSSTLAGVGLLATQKMLLSRAYIAGAPQRETCCPNANPQHKMAHLAPKLFKWGDGFFFFLFRWPALRPW